MEIETAIHEEEVQDEANVMFDKAIEHGHLSHDTKAANYAGMYMYMGKQDGKALFKHINTRSYHNWTIVG